MGGEGAERGEEGQEDGGWAGGRGRKGRSHPLPGFLKSQDVEEEEFRAGSTSFSLYKYYYCYKKHEKLSQQIDFLELIRDLNLGLSVLYRISFNQLLI